MIYTAFAVIYARVRIHTQKHKKLRNDDILTNFEKIVIIKMFKHLVGEIYVLR